MKSGILLNLPMRMAWRIGRGTEAWKLTKAVKFTVLYKFNWNTSLSKGWSVEHRYEKTLLVKTQLREVEAKLQYTDICSSASEMQCVINGFPRCRTSPTLVLFNHEI